jgi:hypothetical protein
MKTYYGNYLGIVINNNDPEFRGRVQVFVPHIMPALFEEWNKKGENITINCVGDNMPQGLTSEIIDRLKQILPWSEAASPIVGQSSPGGVISALAGAIKNIGAATAGAISNVGQAAAGAISGTEPPAGPVNLDQTPTSIPAGSLPPGTSCKIPLAGGHVDVKNLKPGFIQRLNGFYEESQKLGYKITCTSGFRSPEKQAALYAKIGSPGAARPGYSTHEKGIAADLYVSGPGVSIQNISVAASRSGQNYDTQAFRDLLAKYGLHQPLHPIHGPSGPEHWHIEPTESPAARSSTKYGQRGPESSTAVAALLSNPSSNSTAETVSSSQFPPASNPLVNKSPSNTAMSKPTSPTTGLS